MELTVRRTYKVILKPEPEFEDEDYPFAELVDACTRYHDIGNTYGKMLYVIDREGTDLEYKCWMHYKDVSDERILFEAFFSSTEEDVEID